MESRREFIRKIIMVGGMFALGPKAFACKPVHKSTKDPLCILYRAVNGPPASNLVKVIEMMGGLEKLIGHDDIVVIKSSQKYLKFSA